MEIIVPNIRFFLSFRVFSGESHTTVVLLPYDIWTVSTLKTEETLHLEAAEASDGEGTESERNQHFTEYAPSDHRVLGLT